jgi:DNA-binding response OmpR family regulator
MTGYAETASMADGFLKPGMQMITKPFAIDSLAARIKAIIESDP